MSSQDDEKALEALRRRVDGFAHTLSASGARTEVLAHYATNRRRFGIPLPPILRPLGRVWRLGSLLMEADGSLRATGHVIRVRQPGRPQFVSQVAEERRLVCEAAVRGHIVIGETVNFDTTAISLKLDALGKDGSPLFVREGRIVVSWSSRFDAVRDAEEYLREGVELLLDPPEGA